MQGSTDFQVACSAVEVVAEVEAEGAEVAAVAGTADTPEERPCRADKETTEEMDIGFLTVGVRWTEAEAAERECLEQTQRHTKEGTEETDYNTT